MTHHVLTHPKKMPRGKMGIYLTQPKPYSFKGILLSPIGGGGGGGEAVLTATYLINRIPS